MHLRDCLVSILILIALLFTATSGCVNESVSEQCASLAEKQCQRCYVCAEGDELASGADVCGITSDTTRDECEAQLEDQCIQQARLDRNPYAQLDQCDSAVEETSCQQRLSWYALDHPRAPAACTRYF